jgi:FAD/FMN-containing dehydrogenase
MGHLSRPCGLTIDNLISAEVVTADGRVLRASQQSEPDLFWAIRGGGGNFGVVTSFEFKAHAIETVFAGPTFFEPDAAVIRAYEAWIKNAPEALNALFAIALAPPAPFVPEEWHLKPVMAVLTCWSGDDGKDEGLPSEVAELGNVVGQALWRMPYPEVNTFFDELLPPGLRHYWKANSFKEFSEEAINVHIEHGLRVPTVEGGIFIMPINGACHRVNDDETAFANRKTSFSSVIAGTWHQEGDDAANIKWVRDYFEALQPFTEAGAYVNFMSGDDQELAESSYGDKHRRLREIKSKYDPHNLFRVNQNIEPA